MTVGIIVVIIAAILIIAAVAYARRGSGRGAAEAELSRLPLRPLSASEREYYLDDWVHVQGSFVDAPAMALDSADTLVGQLLQNVGYPTDDDQRLVRLLSVRHAEHVTAYREARAVHDKRKAGADVDTETIRIALNGYDDLFQDLLAAHKGSADETVVDEAPVDAALAGDAPADRALTGETPTDNISTDNIPSNDIPAEDTPTDDTPTDDTDISTDETSKRRHEAEAAS
jgi:hypothetical protein